MNEKEAEIALLELRRKVDRLEGINDRYAEMIRVVVAENAKLQDRVKELEHVVKNYNSMPVQAKRSLWSL